MARLGRGGGQEAGISVGAARWAGGEIGHQPVISKTVGPSYERKMCPLPNQISPRKLMLIVYQYVPYLLYNSL